VVRKWLMAKPGVFLLDDPPADRRGEQQVPADRRLADRRPSSWPPPRSRSCWSSATASW
jgi:hypothetical protein